MKQKEASLMYINAAYLNNSKIDFEDHSRPLIVGSCGIYRLSHKEEMTTYRAHGRVDYQILYVASGKTRFFFDGQEETVPAGHMVLYRPGEVQKYVYYGTELPEVYWVHFTGSETRNILEKYSMTDSIRVFHTGISLEHAGLFRRMIRELQMCKENYQEYLAALLEQLFIMIHRQLTINTAQKTEISFQNEEAELAITYFHEHYNQEISIGEYAASRHMSTCWFIRSFKQYTGITPMQYILSVRISNAQSLLEATQYNITEISNIVGYDNPLYFSRIFKKQRGLSPLEYRKRVRSKHSHD